ncbi:FlaD/FlaE family flagellar protein [Methanococcus maripaludis]|uniref:Flagellar protein FlaD n=1 Tax=Methanococcus maripaludis TaxID=39152 RepID=A0A7J9PQE7_METMI|nr:FlaD/FlaE family flagellar protein [Methanococcus maripaludis]MBA2867899.1 flagellar protein FlaD [Methanococcus maripaludis]
MIGNVKMEYASASEEYLTESEMDEYLDDLRSKIPSFIVELLKNNLKNRKLTRPQLDKIVGRVSDLYFGKKPEDKKAAELTNKINDLSQKLDALMKVATISSATKVSDDIKKELDYLDDEKIEVPEISKAVEVPEIIEEPEISIETVEEPVVEPVKIIEKQTVEPIIEFKEEPKIEKVVSKVPLEIEEGNNMRPELTPAVETTARLQELPEDTLSTMLVFKWLEFLISRVGTGNLIDVLDYYHNLGWISGKAISKLMKVSKNMKYFHEDIDWKANECMAPEDHVVSLLYIEKLAGRPIAVEELEGMEREINRIKKWAEELQKM